MGALSPWHIAILVVVLVLLFGATRLPDSARSVGRSLRIFKSEIAEMGHDGQDEQPSAQPAAEQPVVQQPVVQQPVVQQPVVQQPVVQQIPPGAAPLVQPGPVTQPVPRPEPVHVEPVAPRPVPQPVAESGPGHRATVHADAQQAG